MTLLRGEFALILMATVPESMSEDELRLKLSELEKKLGLTFSLRELSPEEIEEQDPEEFQFIISVYGADKPGIVAGITRELAAQGLNITDVQTKSVKQNNGEVYVMMLELSSKKELAASKVQERLSAMAKELGVDISVRELEILEL